MLAVPHPSRAEIRSVELRRSFAPKSPAEDSADIVLDLDHKPLYRLIA